MQHVWIPFFTQKADIVHEKTFHSKGCPFDHNFHRSIAKYHHDQTLSNFHPLGRHYQAVKEPSTCIQEVYMAEPNSIRPPAEQR